MSWLGVALIAGAVATASASPPATLAPGQGRRIAVDTPVEKFRALPAGTESPFVYLNRCVGGCVVHGNTKTNDATTQTSTIPAPGDYTIGEFSDANGIVGASADADWAAVVQCMKEVYSPYAVTLTDTVPTGGAYTEAIIAGQPSDLGLPIDVLGIAPLKSDCSAQNDVISFSFANHHPPSDRVNNICWTAAQETAHAFGLDHEFQFIDGASACNDPMTYRVDCGGEKFFRNRDAKCGETVARTCKCSLTQNSHQQLLGVFGAGQSLIAAPSSLIVAPTTTTVANGFTAGAQCGSQRGVAYAEFTVNGNIWVSDPGSAFGAGGQTNPSPYTFTAPSNLPDGYLDIVVRAFDDLGLEGDSAMLTVLKGAPCTSASTCADLQSCTNGRCAWPPAAGNLGDACTYTQFCESNLCLETSDGKVCAENCTVGATDATDACPSGFDCVATTGTAGVCLSTSGGGCCSAGRDRDGVFTGGLAALVFGFWNRKRRSNS